MWNHEKKNVAKHDIISYMLIEKDCDVDRWAKQ